MGQSVDKIFLVLGSGLICGIFFAPILNINIFLVTILVFIFLLFLFKKSIKVFLVFLFLFSFVSGNYYFKLDDSQRVSKYNFKENVKYKIKCSVVGDVDLKSSSKRFFCKTSQNETFLVRTVDVEKNFLHSDTLFVWGTLSEPEPFITNTNTLFEYDEYLKNKRVFWVIDKAKIEILETKNNNFRRNLFVFRDRFIKPFSDNLKSDSKNLFLGIIFGKNILSNTLVDVFRVSGLLHIIALSGYNITIIASWIKSFFSSFGNRVSSIFGIISIVVFILMTGMPITAIRAGIMAVISMIALRSGNVYESIRALFWAVLIMSILNPRLPFYDFGFQLSVLATLGIILFTQKILLKTPSKWPFIFREILATTISAQILVLPLILYETRLFSVVSLPANIFILPFVPIVMIAGILGGILGLISVIFSFPFVFVGDSVLKIIIFLSKFFASLPFSGLVLKDFSLVTMLVFYGIIVFWAYKIRVLNLTK